MQWLEEHWLCVSLILMGGGVWWLMPRGWQLPRVIGLVTALAGAYLMSWGIKSVGGNVGDTAIFCVFATGAIACAILMITNRNPVYAALWFALATLNVCGLFWLQAASFLAAATVIVYAGAIVVTFVFVIMLAQQSGATAYDQHARQPLLATFAAFLVLGVLLGMLHDANPGDVMVAKAQSPAATANLLSQPAPGKTLRDDPMRGLGRSLFGDYLFAVELAGTLLLIATIGAIAIAPRRSRGTL